MRLYSYVLDHDYGFAPNPFYDVCTLATCKPSIRERAAIGDYVVGTGCAKRHRRGFLPAMAKVARLSRVSSDVLYGFSAYALRHPA